MGSQHSDARVPRVEGSEGSRLEILPADILAALGKTPEQIRELFDEAVEDAQVGAAFGP